MQDNIVRYFFIIALFWFTGCSEGSCPHNANCSILEVPQNRLRDTGLTLKLPVIRFNSPLPSSKSPLLYLQGGPGGSVLHKARLDGARLASLLKRDIVYLVQRGTEGAWPSLVCKPQLDVRQCEQELTLDRLNLASFNTIESAEDVADLSIKLNTPFVLWGSSYGTRLAQRVAQRHPEVVDSLILEGSIPSDASETINVRQQSIDRKVLERLSSWVKKKIAGDGTNPVDLDPNTDFIFALEAVVQSPLEHGVPRNQSLSEAEELIKMGRGYAKWRVPLILWAYNVRHGRNKQQSARWLENFLQHTSNSIKSIISYPMYLSTNCSDVYQFWSLESILEAENSSGFPENIALSRIEDQKKSFSSCKSLGVDPSGYSAEEFRIPARSEKKALFLIGMLDTQTPAELAPVSNFSNAIVIRGECLGHVFFEDESLFGILQSFLDDPDASLPTYLIDQYC